MNETELRKILETELPLKDLIIDSGIYEFHQEGVKSLGVSYEHNEYDDEIYIVNVFWNDQYVNVSGEYKNIYDCIPELIKVWNET